MLEERNNIDIYGVHYKEININDKFNIIKNIYNFERGTIYNSCISNELYLINNELGIYWTGSRYMISTLSEKYEEEPVWNGLFYEKKMVFKGLQCNERFVLDEYYDTHKKECDEWLDNNIDRKEYEKLLNELIENNINKNYYQYYELELDKSHENAHLYLENNACVNGGYISLDFNRMGITIENDGLILGNIDRSYNGSNSEEIFESVLKYMFLNRHLLNGFKKLKKGYVFNNEYYEDLSCLVFDLEDQIKNKGLLNKYMNEGLCLNDLNIEISKQT